ncbi:MAG: type I methionyl aminopeptidase [Deltaproteobacteria bacterium]|nr:type I methionyl aminopeptidase [Myxococcales bacterium]TDJ12122.1 MAG: type I methionyl aminopeptidase [Deltaproteobacteria bacterium]TDJ17737.1 MAG: type I methionyl aminopeptidase [Deltaproteobacteria bacterium]
MLSYGQRIPIKTRSEIDKMREAARHVAEVLLILRDRAEPGMPTSEFDRVAQKEISQRGVKSSFKGYNPYGLPKYPAVICISINNEIVHGIPGDRRIEEGDLISIDFGVSVDGYHGDSAVTVIVGEVEEEKRRLVEKTHESLDKGIETMRPGKRLSDIGHAVQSHVEPEGFSVVRDFAGHGIGSEMHEPPWVPNYGSKGRGPRLQPGMVFAIEPMVNAGRADIEILDDEWTAVTADGSCSAHFEHTILIGEAGPDVLTRIEGSH